ncbi:hypothetical protein BX616_001325 [Lobosporangium transversale]|uniref:RING-type domain-containing protein n=1 Tax=Lobosporangium transversale TaxID=64571 RepID=A0A1Y2G862_9FUNG|nr:hypothetical protein BCR41DRAFT_364445 [Lobosporangium transversale]KAF9917338.1 hypothetical protein BX616_001325 [Lobosporangium transversale]ORY98265.1 hypothetical protein BCR41DRAFT_364445 [Lobosporangium transversale]|eukprot:XP_021875694.1 hypothetical protein BCR41DRAFT_364445 [Lobosporangium transversale]
MEHLVQLFPSQSRADLQHYLDRAGGILEFAIDAILNSTPSITATTRDQSRSETPAPKYSGRDIGLATNEPFRKDTPRPPYYAVDYDFLKVYSEPIHAGTRYVSSIQTNEQTRSTKRQRRDSYEIVEISGTNCSKCRVVLDLTQDSSDEEEKDVTTNKKKENQPPSANGHPFLIDFSQRPNQNDSVQLPAEASTAIMSNHLSNFDEFHQEQIRIREQIAKRDTEIEAQKAILVSNFITIAKDMFEDISEVYLKDLLREMQPKIPSDNELVDACIEIIFKLEGRYPKERLKRKRGSNDDVDDNGEAVFSEDEGDRWTSSGDRDSSIAGSSSQSQKRDFMNCGPRMSPLYETQCTERLLQDFPMVQALSINACLKAFNHHYVPTFEYLSSAVKEMEANEGAEKATSKRKAKAKANREDLSVIFMTKRRREKVFNPRNMDPELRKEIDFVDAIIAKQRAEMQEREEEEKNYKYYQERKELIECGCCYDDVPPNRVAQCEEGHLFCLQCSRRGAEVELGYQRTVLKCMTSGCTAVFSDSEAIKFLSKPVFQGLLRARQQNELKMAGLDSLVECPFCTYAAVVENDDDKEFRCQAPKCRKVSCRLCKARTHVPLSCEEYRKEREKNNVLSAQHKVEEQMSQALIRECPKCKSRFFKTEGCNKMTCPQCHTKMCYVCKMQIKDYSHFDQTPAGQPAHNKSLCRLWDNTVERNENDVKEAAQKTLQQLEADRPELAAQVKIQVPK